MLPILPEEGNQRQELLASSHYGERWGRHWLDVVRYADTAGDNSDYPIPQMYMYRNWVIDAFNRDLPYDEFVRQQLAGDLLPHADDADRRAKIIATGYLANSRRFGSYEDKRYPWNLTYDDTIDNLGRAFLGLTTGCCRCHDHKFDPLSQADYYALYGFFSSTRYPWPGIELDKKQRDLVPLAPVAKVAASQQAHEKTFAMAYAVSEGKTAGNKHVGNARMQLKGDPERLGVEVPRRFPTVLGGQTLPASVKGSGRLQLANWIVDPKNPLTARVMVNRLWQYHFGTGIVATSGNFGMMGQPPTHPELLDWLTTKFIESKWSIKTMHRLMMLSRTYQQSSQAASATATLDPSNQWLSYYPRQRLDAESIRDAMLAISGTLDRTPGGEHPFPPMKAWDYTQHKPFKAVYDTNRRSVYLMTQRIQRHPFLALFDGADTNAGSPTRTTSTTSLQALYLMNDPFVHTQARQLAKRLKTTLQDDHVRIVTAYQLIYGRLPSDEELHDVQAFLQQVRETSKNDPWESLAHALFLSNEFVYVE